MSEVREDQSGPEWRSAVATMTTDAGRAAHGRNDVRDLTTRRLDALNPDE